MEISFKRASYPNSSKPPIVRDSNANHSVIAISSTGSISAQQAQERMRSFFRENSNPSPSQNKSKCAHNTLDNDVFIIRGENAQSATITKRSCEKLQNNNEQKHILTQINLQPKKAKKQAAFYFDTTAMQGKQIAGIEIDKSKKGRVRIKVKTLDVMA